MPLLSRFTFIPKKGIGPPRTGIIFYSAGKKRNLIIFKGTFMNININKKVSSRALH